MVDVKVYYSQQDWVQTFLSKSTTVNKIGFKPFANGGCQSLLQPRKYLDTFAELTCIYKFNEWIPENVLII